jgi:hypothetical protein
VQWIEQTPVLSFADPAAAVAGAREIMPLSRRRLRLGPSFAIVPASMSNRAIWSMRKRHEWLASPLKKKRVKRATRLRCGLQDAMDRKGGEKTE